VKKYLAEDSSERPDGNCVDDGGERDADDDEDEVGDGRRTEQLVAGKDQQLAAVGPCVERIKLGRRRGGRSESATARPTMSTLVVLRVV